MNDVLTIERVKDKLEPMYAAELALIEERMKSETWTRIELIDRVISELPEVTLPLNHVFTPGIYVREIFLPKGTLLTSRIHLTRHPFFVSLGVVSVWDDDNGWVTLRAPHTGITEPGTRRILFSNEDTIWATVHATDETDPDEIVKQITFTGGKFNQLGAAASRLAIATEGRS